MSTPALAAPSRSLVAADLLKLRRRRGLLAVVSVLTMGAIAVTYGIIELLHVANPAKHGPAGGIINLGHGAWLAAALGSVAAAIVGSSAGAGDLNAGVYRELLVTGRSRLALYASRIPGGLAYLLPFVAVGYGLAAVATVVFAGGRPAPGFELLVTTPILASIPALGVVRELVPGVALQDLAPAALGDSVRQGPQVPMSLAAIAATLVAWTLTACIAGGWCDTRRDA